jgi:serine/threonine protein kinase
MVTTDLGACEWFVWELRRSNIFEPGPLDQLIRQFLTNSPRREPPALAEFLIHEGVLTQFQAERILQGRTHGLVLGPYVLMDSVGTGSMGTVYKAKNRNDSQWYVVKVLPWRGMWNVRQAKRKLRKFQECAHPAVVPLVDIATSSGTHHLVWTYVTGEALDQIVQREGKLKAAVAASYLVQIAEGLGTVHKKGLFHGLLKPSNILINSAQHVHILDFGIGSIMAQKEGESMVDTMSTANTIMSALDCASPESVVEPTNLTAAGDQYSLGCVLYYCLTGQLPFEGTAADKLVAHQFKQPKPIQELAADVPRELIAITERLMQKAPEARYSDTSEVIEALRHLAGAKGAETAGAPQSESLSPSRVHNPDGRGTTSRNILASVGAETPPPSRLRTLNLPSRPQATAAELPDGQSSPSGKSSAKPSRTGWEKVSPTDDKSKDESPDAVPPKQKKATPPDYKTGSREEFILENRIGPTGVAIGALLLSLAVWLLTQKLF